MSDKCRECRQPATHWRRYEMRRPDGSVDELYFPFCDPCGDQSKSATSAPRIPLSEVCQPLE